MKTNRSIEMENKLLKCFLIVCGLIGFYTLGVLTEPSMLKQERRESNLYATMVCLGIETDMEFGWPNYKRLEVQCD
jgi:hypothetical protein